MSAMPDQASVPTGATGELAPLRGLRVLCVGTSQAAALTGALLCAQGASLAVVTVTPDEVRVRPERARMAGSPDGDRAGFGDGSAGADELLGDAAVVIDPRPGGTPAPRGWSSEECWDRCKSHVVYCRLPSFSSRDALWRGRSASQALLAGLLGAYVLEEDGSPTLSPLPISACFAALAGALGIPAGLVARERYGTGQRLEVSEHDATLLAIGARAVSVNGQPGADRPSDPWGGPFRCLDGRWVWANLATPKAVRRFAAHVGAELRWERAGYLGRADLSALSPARAALEEELRSLFATRTAAAVLAVDLGISLTMVRNPEEVRGQVADPDGQTAADESYAGFRDERTVVLRSAAADTTEPSGTFDGGGERGETAPWDLVVGDPPSAARHPLAGLRVLDCTQMLAGPLAGRLLADLGASVLKINDPDEDGAGYRWQENRYHTDVNRGKRTALVDLTRSEGRSIAQRLIATADVVLENVRLDAARRLGLDDESLRRWAPGLCHAHVAAFSLHSRWDAPGYEPNAQAIAGLMTQDAAAGTPRMVPFAVDDYGTGLLAGGCPPERGTLKERSST